MNQLVILGGSGIGRIAADIAKYAGYKVIGFLNDFEPVGSQIGKYNPLPVIGTTNDISKYLKKKDYYFFVAYVGLENEKATYEKVKSLNIPENQLVTLIHPTAYIPDGICNIGPGCLIGPYCVLSPDVTIGKQCILLAHSFIGHDSVLEHFAHVTTNGVVGANVHIGKAAHVGSNSVIREKTNIGDFALIGSGSVVLKDVDENTVVAGNPARLIKAKTLSKGIPKTFTETGLETPLHKLKLTIVTPLWRWENLEKLSKSIPAGVRWVVVNSGRKPSTIVVPSNAEFHTIESDRGVDKRNHGIDIIKNGYLYFLDDDTTIHPNFYKLLDMDPEYDFIHFNQVWPNGKRRIGGDVRVNHIDMGSFIVKRELIGNTRFIKNPKADGIFAVECFKKSKNAKYINEELSIFNALR